MRTESLALVLTLLGAGCSGGPEGANSAPPAPVATGPCQQPWTCDPSSASCAPPEPRPDGSRCDNGGPSPGACQGGVCVGTTAFSDAGATVSAPLDGGGGVVAASAGATGLRLELPAGALPGPMVLSLTPVGALAGLPFPLKVLGAARLGPDGLVPFGHARLSIALPAAPAGPVVGFTLRDDGTGLAPLPAAVRGATVDLRLAHFSVAGAGEASCEPQALEELRDAAALTQGFARFPAWIAWIDVEAGCRFPDPEERMDHVLARTLDVYAAWHAAIVEALIGAGGTCAAPTATPDELWTAAKQSLELDAWTQILGQEAAPLGSPIACTPCGAEVCTTPGDLVAAELVELARVARARFSAEEGRCPASEGEALAYLGLVADLGELLGSGTGAGFEGQVAAMRSERRCGVTSLDLVPQQALLCVEATQPIEERALDAAGSVVALPASVNVARLVSSSPSVGTEEVVSVVPGGVVARVPGTATLHVSVLAGRYMSSEIATGTATFTVTASACDDGDPCTMEDTCRAHGWCKGTGRPWPAPGQCYHDGCFHQCGPFAPAGGWNDPTCKGCPWYAGSQCADAPDGEGCFDGDPCTIDDRCQAGVCAGRPLAVPPEGQCWGPYYDACGVCGPMGSPDVNDLSCAGCPWSPPPPPPPPRARAHGIRGL